MRRPFAFLTAVAASLVLLSPTAHAVGTLVDVQVVDRDTGETLKPILHRGEWWIAGRPGARYGVTLSSRTPQRTLGVVSIDGVNAISGDTAAWNQTGYVLAAWQQTRIDGWRKNMAQVAAFEFTALPDSYAARTGRPANVGVIGVALFAERQQPRRVAGPSNAPVDDDRSSSTPADTPVPAPSAADPAQEAPELAKSERLADSLAQRGRIGTGHGEIEQSSIRYVSFRRARETPDEIVTIRYDRAENLVALGILPPPVPPLAATTSANPFPNSGRFVADPPPR